MKKMLVTALLATLALAAPRAAAAAPAPAPAAPRQEAAATAPQPLDLNRATREQLVGVPGIGERLADAIIELRSKQGRFSSLEELLGIRGIGEKNLKRFAQHLTVVAAPAAAPAGAAQQAR